MARLRGAATNPPNRFEVLRLERDPELGPEGAPDTVLLKDPSRTIVSTNDSPDIGFDTSVNPYRGCSHGCAYCYARPTHEYLDMSAGLDFETRILVKERAPELLHRRFRHPSWKPQVLAFSGVTDAYQPDERRLRITRGCIEVCAQFRNPVSIVTKGWLVSRDADLLGELARFDASSVLVSVTTLDRDLQRKMEPGASTPTKRLDAITRLADAKVPVGVMVGPVVPGLTDHEIPAILEAARKAGASYATKVLLRLPHGVKELWDDWLQRNAPDRRAKVENRMRALSGGRLYDARFGVRQVGQGPFARQLNELFDLSCRRSGLSRHAPTLSAEHFRVPGSGTQLGLF